MNERCGPPSFRDTSREAEKADSAVSVKEAKDRTRKAYSQLHKKALLHIWQECFFLFLLFLLKVELFSLLLKLFQALDGIGDAVKKLEIHFFKVCHFPFLQSVKFPHKHRLCAIKKRTNRSRCAEKRSTSIVATQLNHRITTRIWGPHFYQSGPSQHNR